jgi:hypothetical protein
VTPLDGARWLTGRGFPVFPADHPGTAECTGLHRQCDGQRGKHPAVPFTRTRTTDPRQVDRWFGEQLHNVAVPVGAVPGPDGARLLVVDSDRYGAIEDAAAAHGYRHTPTMRVMTAKGHHDYYWAPASLRLGNGLGALRGKFDGDVRAGNAYVIGPGSVHATGVVYELDDPEQPPVPAPAWLLTALTAPPAPMGPAPSSAPLGKAAGGSVLPLIRYVLQAPAGQRNNRLYWAACRAFERSAGQPRAVASALRDAALQAGLTEAEARHTITSAYRSRTAR